MKRVLVFGSRGMLGHQVVKHLGEQDDIEVRGLGREDFEVGADSHKSLGSMYPNFDYVINCIGVIRPEDSNPQPAILANALFPHDLVKYMAPARVIHISTDCVFSGSRGGYCEWSVHDGVGLYSKSKSLGEPNGAMVLRTSIVGVEPTTDRSLISWAKSKKGKAVQGYANHLWNGMTTNTLADVLLQIIRQDLWYTGPAHITSDLTNKADMLRMISERYDLGLRVADKDGPHRIMTLSQDTLQSQQLRDALDIPPIAQQIAEL